MRHEITSFRLLTINRHMDSGAAGYKPFCRKILP